MPKCICGQKFNFPGKGEHAYNWEQLFCSQECWRKSPEYKIRKTKFYKLYRSLHESQKEFLQNEIQGMPLDYTDEVYYWLEELKQLYG
jgi:hypothetical protein